MHTPLLCEHRHVLLQVQTCWADHCQQMLTLRSIFLYLDRTHAISTAGVKSLFEMGLQLFRKHLAEHPEVSNGPLQGHGTARDVTSYSCVIWLWLQLH